jgi:ribonuclease P protein component
LGASIKQNSFPKEERLSSASQIEILFKEGKREYYGNIRAVYRISNFSENSGAKVLISVSKSLFRKAVERNRIKRQIREAYRLNRSGLNDILAKKETHILLGLIYTGKSVGRQAETASDVKGILNRLIRRLEKTK